SIFRTLQLSLSGRNTSYRRTGMPLTDWIQGPSVPRYTGMSSTCTDADNRSFALIRACYDSATIVVTSRHAPHHTTPARTSQRVARSGRGSGADRRPDTG